jgi:hypothetical protein
VRKKDTDTSFAPAFIIQFYAFLYVRNNINYFSILNSVFGSTKRRLQVTYKGLSGDVTDMRFSVCNVYSLLQL